MSTTALFWGLLFSFFGPTLALILTELFGATPQEVGWSLLAYNAVGLLVSLGIPAWADHRGEYLRPMLMCALMAIAFCLGLLVIGSLWAALIALLLLAAPATVGLTLLFAHLRHAGFDASDVLNVRAWVSFAWIAGQPLATLVIGAFGSRAVVWLMLGSSVVLSLLTVAMMRQSSTTTTDEAHAARSPVPEMELSLVALVAIFGAFVALNAGNGATMAVTQLLIHDQRGLPVIWAGIALGIAAGLEVPALMLLARLHGRVSSFVLVGSGAISFIFYYVGMATITNPWLLMPLQGLKSWGFATMTGVGLTIFQSVIARPGLASGLFNNAAKVGAILSGLLISLGATPSWGFAGVFWLAVPATAVGLLLVLVAAASARRTQLASRASAADVAAGEPGPRRGQ